MVRLIDAADVKTLLLFRIFNFQSNIQSESGFAGIVVSMQASGTQDLGFAPGRIFRAKKSSACLISEGK
jgi:hypothetical protein